MTTLQQVSAALGQDKLTVLAVAIDQVRSLVLEMETAACFDDQIETLDLIELADKHGVTAKALRDKIGSKLGPSAVIRLGKRLVIRKTRYLEFLRSCEEGAR